MRARCDEGVQHLLRVHICPILQACSRHTADLDAGVPARGLNGEAYRGHVFWDELYVYPFLSLRMPEITRALLMYRYRRLEEARAAAQEAGFRGAMFPWQSGSEGPGGLRNNGYTNVMVAWLCGLAGELPSLLPDSRSEALRSRLEISDEELDLWRDMSRRMFVPFHGDGIISQFEGYEQLDELDWEGYRERYGNIQRLDRILRAEGDDPDRYKVSKQADVVMLFYLFSPMAVRRLFERLGYEYRPDTAARNIAYYDQRTSHGSTL